MKTVSFTTVAEAREALREEQRQSRWLKRCALALLVANAVGLIALVVWSQWIPFQ